jgi:anthranilate synthase component 1
MKFTKNKNWKNMSHFFPDKKTFVKLAEKGNVVPVYREILADFDTPLSAFLKTRQGDYSYMLESVEGGENMARYSFLGSSPSLVIKTKGNKIKFLKDGQLAEKERYIDGDPLDEIRRVMQGYRYVPVPGLPRFCGGLVGFIGYDTVRFIEDIPDMSEDRLNMPDTELVLTDTLLIFDHVDHKIKVVSNALIEASPADEYEKACAKIDSIVERLRSDINKPVPARLGSGIKEPDSNFSRDAFCKAVEDVKEHIKAGDIIQLVLSQRFERETEADPFSIYRALRSINPSPYMFYLHFGDYKLIGSSPEILVRCEDRRVEVRPIAGTRRRSPDEEEDKRLEKELLADPKEKAEHIMLVDLGRNDIGRVCRYGTVSTEELMRIERYSHVMHMVSDVTGELQEDKDIYDLIRATFPAGTVSGAPKVKAMELIEKFEGLKRGPYAGSVGYISFSGNTDLCITIRTIIMKDRHAYIQAGAGLVLDSVPEKEYEETKNKAMALLKAIETAEKGLE